MSTETVPNDATDKLLIQLEHMRKEIARLTERVKTTENTTRATLQAIAKAETYFDLRVKRTVHSVLNHFVHELEHNITANVENLKALERGFEIRIVDGVTEFENKDSIIVRRREDGFDFSSVQAPDVVNNTNTEPFSKWFTDHPELFDGQQEILINILLTIPKEELEAEQAAYEQVEHGV